MSERMSSLQVALEMVDGLTLEEQEVLLEVVSHRFVERRCAELAGEIAITREAYSRGKVRRGAVNDLLAELRE